MNKPDVMRCVRSAMLVLLPSFAACTQPLQPSTAASCPSPVTLPALQPSLAKPPQAESYSDAAQRDISQWQQELTNSAIR